LGLDDEIGDDGLFVPAELEEKFNESSDIVIANLNFTTNAYLKYCFEQFAG
jgi:hypothetical protein